jgi:hypothetical protein
LIGRFSKGEQISRHLSWPSADVSARIEYCGGRRFSVLVAVAMEQIDSLNFLIRVQGEIKRCRELADRSSDRKFAADLYRLADEMEKRVRELDRL